MSNVSIAEKWSNFLKMTSHETVPIVREPYTIIEKSMGVDNGVPPHLHIGETCARSLNNRKIDFTVL